MRRLEAATVAFLAPGDEANDRAHNQQGESTSIVRTDGRPGRRAAKWFSYDLPLAGGTPAALVVTYNRDNRRARSFEVVIDGERVAQERIAFDSESRFYDREYALPPALVQGKTQLTIRFQGEEGNEVAPVYGLRLIRAAWRGATRRGDPRVSSLKARRARLRRAARSGSPPRGSRLRPSSFNCRTRRLKRMSSAPACAASTRATVAGWPAISRR